MKMKKKLFFSSLVFVSIIGVENLHSQNVAINASGASPVASAMLDISSTTMGMLIPRMTTAQRTAIAAPATGLEVYDTTTGSFWYFNGAIWVQEVNTGTGWLLTGNTLAGTEFIGSVNAQPFMVRTSNVERMRVTAGGLVGIGTAAPGYLLTLAGVGDIFAVDNQASFTAKNAAAAYETYFWPRWSDNIMYMNYGSSGFNIRNNASVSTMFMTNANFVGIGTTAPTFKLHVLSNIAASEVGYFDNQSSSGIALEGINSAGAATTNGGTGVYGFTSQASTNQTVSAGILGKNANNSTPGTTGGTAIVGAGAGVTYNYLLQGQGGAFTGYNYGMFAQNINFTGFTQQAAIACYDGGGNQLLLNAWSATNTHYKIWGGGAWVVSCAIPDTANKMVTLHCSETPEFYFEDYGQGQLVNGKAHIDIDPNLAKNIVISDKHPLRVFIQLEDNETCMGVIVKNKTGTGFDVVELNGGTSSTPFQWHIICNVKDQVESGRVNHLENLRFEPGPVTQPTAAGTKPN
jgi:hypothetical protein